MKRYGYGACVVQTRASHRGNLNESLSRDEARRPGLRQYVPVLLLPGIGARVCPCGILFLFACMVL